MDATVPSRPTIRYSHSLTEGIPHSQQPRSALVQLAKQSMSNATISSAYNSRLLSDSERRSQSVNTGQGNFQELHNINKDIK